MRGHRERGHEQGEDESERQGNGPRASGARHRRPPGGVVGPGAAGETAWMWRGDGCIRTSLPAGWRPSGAHRHSPAVTCPQPRFAPDHRARRPQRPRERVRCLDRRDPSRSTRHPPRPPPSSGRHRTLEAPWPEPSAPTEPRPAAAAVRASPSSRRWGRLGVRRRSSSPPAARRARQRPSAAPAPDRQVNRATARNDRASSPRSAPPSAPSTCAATFGRCRPWSVIGRSSCRSSWSVSSLVLSQYFPKESLVAAFNGYFSGVTPVGAS